MTEAHRPPPRRSARRTAVLAAVSAALAAAPLGGVASADTTHRLTASDNVTAAIAWSQFSVANGAATTAVLARDDVFADALASGVIQGELEAPLLLTGSSALDPRTLAELQRIGADRVIVLGGEGAISAQVVTALDAAGFTTERVSGPTRIETAIAVADRIHPVATNVVVARAFADGDDPTRAFADTLATGNYAAATGMPVIFTNSDELPDIVAAFLARSAVEFVTVAGGTEAVSDDVVASIRGIVETEDSAGEIQRLSGANRFATAVAMAQGLGPMSAASADRVILVEGQQADAWASGFPAAIQSAGAGVPLVLSNQGALPMESEGYLANAEGSVPLICGPYVDDAACDAASSAMGNS